jgi:4-hydroxybenzoyl-CoA reductase subunit beta
MKLPEFEYFSPRDIPSTLELLAIHGSQAVLLAGGTDLVVRMKQQLLKPGVVINLKDVEELKGMERRKDNMLFIGALTRITELLESSIIQKKYPGLYQAAEAVSAPPLQNMGTVGGNLLQETRCLYYNQTGMWRRSKPLCFKAGGSVCNAVKGGKHCFATYQGDLAPMLIALSTQAILSRKGESRTIPLEELYSGKGKFPIKKDADELLEGVISPPAEKNRVCHYEKLRLRQALDYPLVGVAVSMILTDDKRLCKSGRLVLTAVGSGPVIVDDSDLMKDAAITDEWIGELSEAAYKAAKPVANVLTPPAYRKRMARVLTRRTLTRALER